MSEKTRILDLLDRAYRSQAWHGPALLESLAGLGPSLAAKRPVRGAHTIWEIVEHVATWNEIVARRLAGEAPKLDPAMNFFQPARPTPAAWKATLRRLARTQALFRREVARFPVERLGRQRPKLTHTWSVMIHGQIQHALYHAGQIVMLRRALGKPAAPH